MASGGRHRSYRIPAPLQENRLGVTQVPARGIGQDVVRFLADARELQFLELTDEFARALLRYERMRASYLGDGSVSDLEAQLQSG